MANPLTEKLVTGTVGELIVQLRLFQFDVQAFPPLKDTGNDLIALRRHSFHTIQVKTRTTNEFTVGNLPKFYTAVALVHLDGYDNILNLDSTIVYLLSREEFENAPCRFDQLNRFELNDERVDALFGPVPVGQLGNVPKLKGVAK